MTDDLEADVARLRAKWFGPGSTPTRVLDPEEEAVAARWLGKTEASRLARTTGERRYRPPVVIGHYGYIPRVREAYYDNFTSALAVGDYWYVEVFRGAEKETVFKGERDSCLQAVARLQRMGISVTRVGSERSPEEMAPSPRSKPARSRRFEVMEQLSRFRA